MPYLQQVPVPLSLSDIILQLTMTLSGVFVVRMRLGQLLKVLWSLLKFQIHTDYVILIGCEETVIFVCMILTRKSKGPTFALSVGEEEACAKPGWKRWELHGNHLQTVPQEWIKVFFSWKLGLLFFIFGGSPVQIVG